MAVDGVAEFAWEGQKGWEDSLGWVWGRVDWMGWWCRRLSRGRRGYCGWWGGVDFGGLKLCVMFEEPFDQFGGRHGVLLLGFEVGWWT